VAFRRKRKRKLNAGERGGRRENADLSRGELEGEKRDISTVSI
jgi:hypothetical protein